MPPVGSDLLKRSLNDVAATTFGGAFLTGFFAGFAAAFLIGAATFGFTTGFGLVTTFGLTTLGLTVLGLVTLLELGPLPFRASITNCPSWV
jgi:hypothetical protein